MPCIKGRDRRQHTALTPLTAETIAKRLVHAPIFPCLVAKGDGSTEVRRLSQTHSHRSSHRQMHDGSKTTVSNGKVLVSGRDHNPAKHQRHRQQQQRNQKTTGGASLMEPEARCKDAKKAAKGEFALLGDLPSVEGRKMVIQKETLFLKVVRCQL